MSIEEVWRQIESFAGKAFMQNRFKPGLKLAGLNPTTRIHDLRPPAASIATARGANVKEVQQTLGHTSATVTLDTYSHVFPSLAEQHRDRLGAAHKEARSGSSRASG